MKILIQDEHGVRELEEGYATEEELQTFLRDHAELIPVDEIELGTPPLLCIGWEVSVASGSEDLLYVDETGLLTIVETKLRKNPEARREVVGQILEYGAQASAWSPNDIEVKAQKFLSSAECPQEYRGLTLEQSMRYFLERTDSPGREAFSYENFLNLASGNLERGHIRLVIAIDEPPDPLLRIVEFVNRFSERFEMYLIQLKRFHDSASGQNIFVPALFGRVARKRPRGRQWDKESFFEDVERKRSGEETEAVRQLYELAKTKGRVQWGTATTGGSFLFQVAKERRWSTVFNIHANQGLWISFGSLRRGGVAQETLQEFGARLNTGGVAVAEDAVESEWYAIGFPVLAEDRSLEVFKDAVLWLCRQI